MTKEYKISCINDKKKDVKQSNNQLICAFWYTSQKAGI